MGAEAAPAPPPERAAPAPSAAARALMEAFDGRLGRVTVAMKAEAAQMSAAGRFAVAEHAPQRDGRELLKLRDGAAELVIDAKRVVDIAYEDRGAAADRRRLRAGRRVHARDARRRRRRRAAFFFWAGARNLTCRTCGVRRW